MYPEFTRKSVRDTVWFLKTIGINVYDNRSPIRTIHHFILLYPVILTGLSILLYVWDTRKNIDEAVLAAAYIGAVIILVLAIPNLLTNKAKILKIMQTIDTNVYSYPDESQIKVSFKGLLDEQRLPKIYISILTYECLGYSLSAVSPIIGYFLTGIYDTSMYPSSYPWEADGVFSQIIISVMQLAGVTSAFWAFYTFQVFFVFFTIEFLRQCQRLCSALSGIGYRTEITARRIMNGAMVRKDSKFRTSETHTYNDVYKNNIVHCIKHYQELLRLFELFKPWFSLFFSVELAISAGTFALVFYNLFKATDPNKFLTIIGSSFNVIANFFSRCIIGEMFADTNSKIMNTILHNVNWYDQSLSNRKLILMLHMLAKRPNRLAGFSVFTASYFTFAYILRMSYSYFNILRSS